MTGEIPVAKPRRADLLARAVVLCVGCRRVETWPAQRSRGTVGRSVGVVLRRGEKRRGASIVGASRGIN